MLGTPSRLSAMSFIARPGESNALLRSSPFRQRTPFAKGLVDAHPKLHDGLHRRNTSGEARVARVYGLVSVPGIPNPFDYDPSARLPADFDQHDGSVFSIPTAPSVFFIGNITSLFHESGIHPPVRAAFAMSL